MSEIFNELQIKLPKDKMLVKLGGNFSHLIGEILLLDLTSCSPPIRIKIFERLLNTC